MINIKEYSFSEIMEGFFDGPHATPSPSEEGPVFLGIKNIKPEGGIDLSEIRHISEKEYPKWTKRVTPQKDDIVFSYEATLHRYALIPEGFRGCLGRRMALIRVDKTKVEPLYLYFYFLSPYWKAFIETIKISGATVDRISIIDFPKYKISLPSLTIQRKIISIISNYIDLVENNNRRMNILEKVAEEIYKEWFIRLRFPNWKEIKIEHGIPDGWEEIIVEEAFEIIGGGTPRKDTDEYWVDGNINWFTPSDITAAKGLFLSSSGLKTNKLGLRKSSSKLFPPYSVMMTSRATIGAIGINTTKACTNQGFIICIPNEKIIFPYILNWIKQNTPYIELIASGATFKEIGRSLFKKLKILRPDKKTMDDFSQIVIPVYKEIEILQTKNTNLQKTRDLLLPRLVSGKLSLEHLVPETATF